MLAERSLSAVLRVILVDAVFMHIFTSRVASCRWYCSVQFNGKI